MKDRKRFGFRRGCVIVAAAMTAAYWTLRTVEAGMDLYGTVSPWG